VAAEPRAWRRGRRRRACRVGHDQRLIQVSVLVLRLQIKFFHAGVWDDFYTWSIPQFLIASTHQIAKGFRKALKFIISA